MNNVWIKTAAAVAALGAGIAISSLPASADTTVTHTYTRESTTTTTVPMKAHRSTRTPYGDAASRRHYHVGDNVQLSDDRTTATAVFLGGTPVMRFRNSAGGFSPEQRALMTQDRLNRVLSTGPIKGEDITTDVDEYGDAVVRVKGDLLFTADPDTAAINASTPMELATTWADNMRALLPQLTKPTNGSY